MFCFGVPAIGFEVHSNAKVFRYTCTSSLLSLVVRRVERSYISSSSCRQCRDGRGFHIFAEKAPEIQPYREFELCNFYNGI